jgi:hypothetical protein
MIMGRGDKGPQVKDSRFMYRPDWANRAHDDPDDVSIDNPRRPLISFKESITILIYHPELSFEWIMSCR